MAASEAYLDGAVDIIHENFDGVMGKINGKPGGQAIKISHRYSMRPTKLLTNTTKRPIGERILEPGLNVNIN